MVPWWPLLASKTRVSLKYEKKSHLNTSTEQNSEDNPEWFLKIYPLDDNKQTKLPSAHSSHVLQVVLGPKPLIPESRPVGGWGKDVTDDVIWKGKTSNKTSKNSTYTTTKLWCHCYSEVPIKVYRFTFYTATNNCHADYENNVLGRPGRSIIIITYVTIYSQITLSAWIFADGTEYLNIFVLKMSLEVYGFNANKSGRAGNELLVSHDWVQNKFRELGETEWALGSAASW